MQVRGGAAVLLGHPEKARQHYQQALEICTKVRFRPEIALTRLEFAELLLGELRVSGSEPRSELRPGTRNTERETALGHLDFAIEEFRAMKMQPYLERALRHKGLLKA